MESSKADIKFSLEPICAECGKKLPTEMIAASMQALIARKMLGKHIRDIEINDYVCVECINKADK